MPRINSDRVKTVQIHGRIAGVTLIELLIGLFILQLIIAPLYLMFSSSKRTMYKAADLLQASNLASSLLAGLKQMPAKHLSPQPLVKDSELSGNLSLEKLNVKMGPPEFKRELEIIPVKISGSDDKLFIVEVRISWFNRNSTTEAGYTIRDILRGG